MVDIELLQDTVDFGKLEQVWNRVVETSSSSRCHSTYEWLSTWWKHFSGGNHLFLLMASEHGTPVGLAPFYIEDGTKVLHFLGQGLSDYADLIVPRGRQDISDLLVAAIVAHHDLWDGLDLEEVPEDSPNVQPLDRLRDEQTSAAWQKTVRCPYLPLSGTWDEFYLTLGKGFRHEVRNKLNRWDAAHGGEALQYRDSRAVDGDLLGEMIALSAERQAADGHRSPFLNHPDQEFLQDVLPTMGAHGQLRIGELRGERELLAFILAFYWRGVAYTWNTQYKPSYASYSPGRLVLVRFVEQRFREGCRELDFMRGEERYKFDWTSYFRTNLALRSSPMASGTKRSRAKPDRTSGAC